MSIVITALLLWIIIYLFPHKDMPLSMVKIVRYVMPKASKEAYQETVKIDNLVNIKYDNLLNEIKTRGFITSIEFTILHHQRIKEIDDELKRRKNQKSK